MDTTSQASLVDSRWPLIYISTELIELARENSVYLLCLPTHTTHMLQPLDVNLLKSQACHKYVMQQPGQVAPVDVLASLVGEA